MTHASKEEIVGWAAMKFASKWHSRDINLKKLQTLALRSKNADIAYNYAKRVPGANIKRLTEIVIRYGDAKEMRTFAMNIPGADKQLLENWAIIYETFFN
jgi:hypothetical protein